MKLGIASAHGLNLLFALAVAAEDWRECQALAATVITLPATPAPVAPDTVRDMEIELDESDLDYGREISGIWSVDGTPLDPIAYAHQQGGE